MCSIKFRLSKTIWYRRDGPNCSVRAIGVRTNNEIDDYRMNRASEDGFQSVFRHVCTAALKERIMQYKDEVKTDRARGYELFGALSAVSIALFQVVVTWTRNAKKIDVNVFMLNVMIALSLMLVIYLVIRVLTNDAFFGTLLSGLVFETSNYFLKMHEAVNSWFTINKIALILILALLAAVIALVLRRPAKHISKKNVKSKLLLLLCVIGWGLILFNVVVNFTSVSLSVKRATRETTTPVMSEKGPTNDALTDAEKPNIYLIVLDEYARTDMMNQQYGFDNTAFDAYLTGKGFHVSSTSENEIAATDVQSANLLNLDYVFFASNLQLSGLPRENLYDNYADYRTKSYLFDLMRANEYYSFAIDNPGVMYGFGNVNADEVLKMETSTAVKITFDQNEVDFMLLLWDDSILHAVDGIWYTLWGWMDKKNNASIFDRNVTMVQESFAFIENYEPSDDTPTILYAHILCPHLPFAFYPDGEIKDASVVSIGWDAPNAYTDNLQYATTQIERGINHLLEVDPDCVIILLSDHGARIHLETAGALVPEFLPILNAVYFGGKTYSKNEGLSGVNTLRAVLSDALQIDLPLVEPPIYLQPEN